MLHILCISCDYTPSQVQNLVKFRDEALSCFPNFTSKFVFLAKNQQVSF